MGAPLSIFEFGIAADVLVGNNGNGNGLVDGLLSMILWNQTGKKPFDPNQPTPPDQPFPWVEPAPLPLDPIANGSAKPDEKVHTQAE